MNNKYYTCAYLREDGSPYDIGKGKGYRAYKKNKGEVGRPVNKDRIIFLKKNLTEEEAFKHEIYMIGVFGRKDLGTGILYNKTNGGDGNSGKIVSKKTREKLSEINKGKTHSEETKRKISEVQKNKTLSEEHKRKLREILTSDERRKLMSEKMKKRYEDPEERLKTSKQQKGKIVSEEARKNMSEAASLRWKKYREQKENVTMCQ